MATVTLCCPACEAFTPHDVHPTEPATFYEPKFPGYCECDQCGERNPNYDADQVLANLKEGAAA